MKTPIWLLITACFTLVVFGCSRTGEAEDKPSRDAAFQEFFGFPPPTDVNEIRSSWHRDIQGHYVRWIGVSCGASTLMRIRSDAKPWPERFVILNGAPGTPDNISPEWWTTSRGADLVDRFVLDRSESSGKDIVYVWADAKAGTLYAARNVVP